MRRTVLILRSILAAAVVVSAIAVTGASAADRGERASAGSGEVLSIENAQGVVRITGRGYLNMRVTQGTVAVVDQSPADRFSPYLGGIPRGRSSSVTGRDVNLYVLGGRYKVTVRGSGISISARGDGSVVVQGVPDPIGDAGTIRIGDVVRAIPEGESKASFGGTQGVEASSSQGGGSSSGGRS